MKIVFFANRMPDLCGAFLHDIDLGIELLRRGHNVMFLVYELPKIGYALGKYRDFNYIHFSAGGLYLDASQLWITPHSPILPSVRKLNNRGYNRPLIATCHFDGNYTAISGNVSTNWNEMLVFINTVMEPNYRKNVIPWPLSIKQTETVKPILHREKIVINEPFVGTKITLINANQNKGVNQFIDIAKKMPDREFLGVLPYYGELRVPPSPDNIEWVPFNDDVRVILKKTRILLVPSYYESFGRVAIEAMVNGIPVIYSKPNPKTKYPGGSTEGLDGWISGAAISCDRDKIEEWTSAIETLDNEETYTKLVEDGKSRIESLNLFTEATRIANKVEEFARINPVKVNVIIPLASQVQQSEVVPQFRAPTEAGRLSFATGRLRLAR